MKQQLRQIYDDLSNGRLSQQEALDKIRAIKLYEQGDATGALLIAPVWQTSNSEVPAGASHLEYTEHHVVLCELPAIDGHKLASFLPHCDCLPLSAGQQRNIAQRYSDHALACFERIQAILQRKNRGKVLVQIVIAEDREGAVLAGLSGLLKTAALENPQLIGQCILVAADVMAEGLCRHLQEGKSLGLEPRIKYKQGERQVLRWQEVSAGRDMPPIAFTEQGVYLITGGIGSLGRLFAREILAETRTGRVVLTGRSPLTTERQALIEGLSAQAGRVGYQQVDIGDPDQVRRLIAGIQDEYGQLTGILHSAGMIADNFILKKTTAEFSEVLAPKVAGTFNLDRASQDVELDFFVMFSSFAGAMGNVGQADYATANAFMDHFAAYRNRQVASGQRHGRTRSVNWPLWTAGGMTLDPATRERLQQTTGIYPMQTATGLDAFYRILASPYDQILVGEGDLEQMRRALLADSPVRSELSALPAAAEHSGASEPNTPNIDRASLAEKTEDYLRRQCSELLKLPAQKIDPQAPLEKYGIDSILAMKLTSHLEKSFGSLSKTLFFEYQTIRELSRYFTQSYSERLATLFAATSNADSHHIKPVDTQVQTLPPAQTRPIIGRRFSRLRSGESGPARESDPIAIIGLSGRYPEAVNIDAFWDNLREGKDCIIEVPAERWDWRKYFTGDRSKSGQHYSKWGGFIAGVDEFDPLFFNIAPKEAKTIDPQERLFLQHVWMAIEDAGYTRASLQVPYPQDLPGQVGVYVGVMYSEYQLFGAESSIQGKRLGIAGSVASIANRVSYALNLHGPSMTLDTMCSSSLTAIHLACQDLKHERTSLAIAGGVNVTIHPNKYLVLSAGQFISSDGHCQSFGEGGDGYIPGEGVGAVVLKRFSEAKRDGDHIYGIIRGSVLNHGGKTNGYTVPNPQAQATAISRALAESHVDPRHISYIEAHGTGTKLGDPIEIAALSKAFQQQTQDTEFCLIGSAKSNIGHCESAAGIAGLTKVLLQMQHRQVVPSLHSAELNPHIDFSKSPFVVNQSLRTWEQPVVDGRQLPRIAGISSFGAGGSNAHLIVEEYQPAVRQEPVSVPAVLIVLSARTAEQLRQKARDLLDFVRARLSTIDLVAVAYTLQVGREAMDERLGFVVSSAEQLAAKLQSYLNGLQGIEDAYEGQVKRNKEALSVFSTDADLQQTVDKWIADNKLSRLVDLWVKGLELDWSKLYGEDEPQRLSLPTYPFAKERYWIDTPAGGPLSAKSVTTAALHPLLHQNTSDLSEQRYSSVFMGDEFFLVEHHLRSDHGTAQKALPAVACLEMARAAIERAWPVRPQSGVLELRDTVWRQPIVVTENQAINIALFPNGPDEIEYEIYSGDADQEIVHCQGRAIINRQAAPAALDFAQLQGQLGSDQLLTHLRLPSGAEDGAEDYVLHPSLMGGALQGAAGLLGMLSERSDSLRLPSALQSLRIVAPCTKEMAAWVRYSPGGQGEGTPVKLDIDLCDQQGHVCVQMRGLSWQQTEIVEPVVAKAQEPKEIDFTSHTQVTQPPIGRKKPRGITLAAPAVISPAAEGSAENAMQQSFAGRPPITLSKKPAPVRESEEQAASSVRLYDRGAGVFAIQVSASGASHSARAVIARLRHALDRVQQEASIKVLMISGAERCLGHAGSEDYNEAVEQKLFQTILTFTYPVVAVLQGDTTGAGFLMAALCDFMVCNEDALYGYTNAQHLLYPGIPETVLFSKRFGDARAQDCLYVSTASTGKQLRSKGWTCPFVPVRQVEAYAQELAATLATKSQDALRLLKQHLTRHLVAAVEALMPAGGGPPATENRSDGVAKTIVSSTKHLRLDTTAENVLVITFSADGDGAVVQDVVADLGHVFTEVERNADCKAVVLFSEYPEFLPRAAEAIPENVVVDFQRMVVGSRVPVIAALNGNAKGEAWLASQFCDASVYSSTGVYSSAHIEKSAGLAHTAAAVFTHRFGSEAAGEILITGADYSGADLQRRAGAVIVAERDQVLPTAVRVAESWARLPRTILVSWKKHSATTIREKIRSLPAADGWEQKDDTLQQAVAAPTPIALRSEVITATAHPGGIVVVKMEEREAKNMFSDALVAGVSEVFAHLEQNPAYKVVVLTGYDSYFASGGTKEGLLAIQQGKARFTDFKIYQSALDCRLPVIAAMQGHSIGAGWSMGMFGDIVLLSEESRYVSPYMNYGFTPGAGATYILPEKIGQDLARESLLTAQQYTGRELKERGLRLRVVPRAEVYPAAMALAKQIAQTSRDRLISLKQQLTGYVRQPLEETYSLELAMHEKTFVGQADTLAQIHSKYQEFDTPPAGHPQPKVELVNPSMTADILPAVTASLKTLLATELQMRESDVDENAQFVDLGLDSISGVSWIRKINEKYQTSIEATKVYTHPTLAQLSRYVKEEAEKHGTVPRPGAVPAPVNKALPRQTSSVGAVCDRPGTTERAPKKLTSRRNRRASRFVDSAPAIRPAQPIAVIGMAGQFPQAKNLEEFWQNLAEGRNCITQVPSDRWDVNAYYQLGEAVAGKTNSQWVGALEEYDRFDPLFFNISPTEAESMDPQQRLFLQTCWHSIENAGYDARVLSGSKCGVFVGCAAGDYHLLSRQHQLSAQGFTGGATSILAARISYFLNLQGPCVSIDTACSSSLVALAQACDSLNSSGSDLALAGGVYAMAGPEMHIKTSQAAMLSPEGRCFTFDQRADGFVPGEGVGVLLLKRLADAQRDQDIIYGVIQGWGVNQDGKTNGITAPNPESQTRLEQDVYDKYEIDPANIQLIEAHGTGTKLGDPIEVEGLKTSFKKYTQNKGYCALGSVKSNIGHCLTAAGIAGVIKLLLALKHKQLPPTINFERLNEHIDLNDSPFYINTRLQEWGLNGAARRQAAISSFGFSGTNAHIVIGECLPVAQVKEPASVATQNAKTVILLSARTPDQLRQKARDLLAFIRKEPVSSSLTEIGYTLQVGRTAMDERLGFVVSSIEQLADKLQAYIDGRNGIEDAYQGQVKRNKEAVSLFSSDVDLQETIDRWIANKKISKLLELWVKGLKVDWSKLYGEVRPRRISLPEYPFAKDRYWIGTPIEQSAANGPSPSRPEFLHPLLHRNSSDLSEQRYSSTFTGDEFFLVDYEMSAEGRGCQKVLPGLAFLEMARAAIDHALPARPDATVLELHKTVWAQPFVVGEGKEVSIALVANDNGNIDYEIYSENADHETVHCEGRAVLSRQPGPGRLDIEQLSGQSLVRLRLPSSAADTSGDYILHPSLLDGALQGAIGIIKVRSDANQPRLPVELETLRIISPCTPEMVAWVRRTPGSPEADNFVRLDIDLCDERGNVCVQMHGLSSGVRGTETSTATAPGKLMAIPVWQASNFEASAAANHTEYAEHHVIMCELQKVSTERLESLVPHSHCLSLRSEQQQTIAKRYSDYALACFERIQTILQGKPQGRILLQVVIGHHQEHVLLAGLSGLLKTAALENARLIGQLVLAAPDITAEELATHLQDEKIIGPDPLIKYEQDARQVLRWQELPEDEDHPPIAFRDQGVYLITGGLGGLGILFAKEILEQTREARVILTGRSAINPEKQDRLNSLSAHAHRLTYRQVDLGDIDQVKRLIVAVRDEYQQLNGIIHSAGMVADNFIVKKAGAEFSEVLAPKVTGTFNLDEASQDLKLDFFVLFSSVAGALGNPGQADYAAANAFMDHFAAYRNRQVAAKQRHGRTRSINWPLWQAGGMALDTASRELVQQIIGAQPMQTATGLLAFYRSLALPHDQLLVVEGIRPKITKYLQEARIFRPLSNTETAAPCRHTSEETEAAVSPDQLQQQVKIILAGVLRIEPSIIDVDQPFVELGLDSFLGAELIVAINKKYGSELSHIKLFDYSTVRAFSLFLEQEIKKSPGYSKKPAEPAGRSTVSVADSYPVLKKRVRGGRRPMSHNAHSDDRIAIIGMSGRYPRASNLSEYWDNLAEGRSAIVEVPPTRWDVNRYYDPHRGTKDKTYSKWLGALDDIDCFDPLFFRISPQEAEYMDPQHRLFLQESYKAFEDAGYSTTTLSNKKCGVYLGISTNEYMSLLSRNGVMSAPVTSNSYAIAAARIAYYLNLKGPAISVDTACSSSLVSVHLACQAILSGEIDMALAGGVSLWLTPESYIAMSQAGMFSPAGQCKTFDDTADGIVNGEGVGAVVLKRLKDAQKDNDTIYGVILGSGINQDGRTNGITAPSVNSQIELERTIYARHKIAPETISYVETHGTGTKLGDPIELEALATVFKEGTSRKNFCALGSVKSNIGHTTSAAGVAGLQKVLLSMRHRMLVPTLNVVRENSRFDFKNSPFYISREKQAWDVAPGSLRRAAVSSFGFSGTNAHLVIEEYPSPAGQAVSLLGNAPFIVLLSARTEEQLRQRSSDLLAFVRAAEKPVDLAAAAYTLQTGREAMEERLGFVVNSADELAEKLSAYINGEKNIEDVYQGRVEAGNEGLTIIGRDDDMQEAIDKWIARRKVSKLLNLWIRGLNIDWNKLYGDVKPPRVSLPTYPFAREHYWVHVHENAVSPDVASQVEVDRDMKSIEDIIDKIGDDTMETDQAVQFLKVLV